MAPLNDFEIDFLERVVEQRPLYVDALSALAEAYTARSLYEKGLTLDKRLAVLCPDDAIVFYNLACSYALLQRVDPALESLEKAAALGYDEWRYMQKDPDLQSLTKEPRFKQLIALLKKQSSETLFRPGQGAGPSPKKS